MAMIGIFFASQMKTISSAWKFLIAISAGIGLPQILRWFWWRVNAWTEISGIISSLLLAIFFYFITKDNELPEEYLLFFIAIISSLCSLVITLITKPEKIKTIMNFFNRVQPDGFWKPVTGHNRWKPLFRDLVLWFLGNISILSFMLSIGYFIFDELIKFLISLIIFFISGIPVIFSLIKEK